MWEFTFRLDPNNSTSPKLRAQCDIGKKMCNSRFVTPGWVVLTAKRTASVDEERMSAVRIVRDEGEGRQHTRPDGVTGQL